MAKVGESDVRQVAILARLEISEKETKRYQSELSNILNYVDQINEAKTDGVEATAQVTGLKDVVRDDLRVPSGLSRDEVLSNAPDKKDGYIKVKSVLE